MHSHPIRAAVFDIDGTLAMIDKDNGTYQALPLRRRRWPTLVPRGLAVVAYTNGTFFPPAHYYPLLAAAGLHLAPAISCPRLPQLRGILPPRATAASWSWGPMAQRCRSARRGLRWPCRVRRVPSMPF